MRKVHVVMCQVHEPEGWVYLTSIKIEVQLYFVYILEQKVNAQFKKKKTRKRTFESFHMINETFC